MSDSPSQPVTADIAAQDDPIPLCTWNIPTLTPGSPLTLKAQRGRITAIVGANGSGKSALGHWLQQNTSGAKARLVIAHRRLWFEFAGPDITSAQREQLATNITAWGQQPDARWRDHAQGQRAGFVLFDLLAQINDYNARFVELVRQHIALKEIETELGISLLDRINKVLSNAHLPIYSELYG